MELCKCSAPTGIAIYICVDVDDCLCFCETEVGMVD